MSHEHVLSGSRLDTAQTVAAGVVCNIPVLLEGPAAGWSHSANMQHKVAL
jgi:hypothetical protein